MLVVRVSIRLSFVRPSVFPDDSLRKFTKLCVCMDIMETWFAIVDRQISSNFDRGICPLHDYGRYYILRLYFSVLSPDFQINYLESLEKTK